MRYLPIKQTSRAETAIRRVTIKCDQLLMSFVGIYIIGITMFM